MSAPCRIQLSRRKGWRKPAGAVVVSRPTIWGNPFGWQWIGRAEAVQKFRDWLDDPSTVRIGGYTEAQAQFEREKWAKRRAEILSRLPELRGCDLACWCPLDAPCHADVLLDLANRPEGEA